MIVARCRGRRDLGGARWKRASLRKGEGLSPIRPETLGERLIPRHPGFFGPLALTAFLLGAAVGLRSILLPFENPIYLGSPFFPPLMIVAVYAGWLWGMAAIGGSILLILAIRLAAGQVLDEAQAAGIVVFAVAAMICVLAAATLRAAVLRLRELSRAHQLAEESARQTEARFRALADSAPAVMWVSQLGGRREFVNRAYVEFAGLPYDEALVLDWRDRLHPADLPRIMKEQVAGENSLKPFTLEARYRRADGELRWLRSFSQPRFAADGEFAGFIGMAIDVTEAKQVEHDLTRINDLLAERVEGAMGERDEAQTALAQAQKLEALGQLTGGVAHDFNNLLTVIIGALDILQRHPEDPKRIAKLTAAALAASRRGERLTQQLLAFSRRQPLRPEIVCIDAMLRESETLYRRAVGEAVGFELELGAGQAVARIDAAQFEAALVNLLVNARDAIETAGAVAVETALVTVDAPRGDLEPGDYLAVSVRDDGTGMSPEAMERAFEPFFTTKAVGKGTGLGLSQVYGFARQSGGGAEIDSAPGQGTTVRMLLPVSTEAPRRAEEAEPHDVAGRRALTVLLVEDDAQVAELVEAMLGELGHTVLRAGSADAALEIAAREPRIGLVLTDVIMPGGKTGVDLAVAVTRLRPGLPVVLSSGYTGEALAAAEAAPWPLLRKPYAIDGLAAAIDEALDNPCRTA